MSGPMMLLMALIWVVMFAAAFWLIWYMEERKLRRHIRRMELDKRIEDNRKQIMREIINF